MIKFILLTLISFSAFAGDEFYRFGDRLVVFKKVDAILVNKSCELPDCEALKQSQENGKAPLEDAWLEGGINPFAARCKHVMGGMVMIGLDLKGNENAFCRFKDDSYLR